MIPFVLGEEEVVLGFSLIGVKGYVPRGPEDAAQEFSKVLENAEPRLLLVTENVAQWLMPEIRTAMLAGALVQVIPGPTSRARRKDEDTTVLLAALGIKL